MEQRYCLRRNIVYCFMLCTVFITNKVNGVSRVAAPKPGGFSPSFHYIDALSVTDFRNPGESSLTKTYAITAPGTYTFVQDIGSQAASTVTGIGNQTALFINSSNVIVDLGGRTLWQNGSTANINGIEINTNLHNITIKNGHIADFKGYGILVNYGCDDIRIQNITVSNCVIAGIGLIGTTTAEQDIRNIVIDNCIISNTVGKATFDAVGLLINSVSNAYISDSVFGYCKSLTDDAYGFSTNNSSHVTVNNCIASGNQRETLAAGFYAFNCTSLEFKNCIAQENNATDTAASESYGFLWTTQKQ